MKEENAYLAQKSAGLAACLLDLACSWLYCLLCLCLCLNFPIGADFCLIPPATPLPSRGALLCFVFIFPYVVLGSNVPTPLSTPAWACTYWCHFDRCFRCFVVFAICLLRRLLYPMLDPLPFVPNIFSTHNLSIDNSGAYTHALVQILTMLKTKNDVFASRHVKTVFSTKSCFTQKPCDTQKTCFTQKPCSCWACARAVCGLQDSSFHGGRRNMPKAVK